MEKHQNTVEEINTNYVWTAMSVWYAGFRAVYHDVGNVNFTFIINNVQREFLNFGRFTLPGVRALYGIGIKAELSCRNDLTIDGRKFSGNAQYLFGNRLLHHGTLLFNSGLEVLQNALNVEPSKIQSKGIKSVMSRATNIRNHLDKDISISEFINLITRYVFEFQGVHFEEYRFSPEDQQNISWLMEEKYIKWDWNYGQSSPFNFKNSNRFAGGKVEVLLEVKNGLISGCKIYGDFLGVGDAADDMRRVPNNIDIRRYFGGISTQELISCFFT